MEIKRSIRFLLRELKDSQNSVHIRMRVYYCGLRFETGLKASLYSKDAWDYSLQRVKPNCLGSRKQSAKQINKRISLYEDAIDECFKFFEVKKVVPTIKELQELFEKKVNPEINTDSKSVIQEDVPKRKFWDIYEEFMEESGQKNDWTVATFEKFNALRHDIETFKKDISFDYFTESGLTKFLVFLRDEKVVAPPKAVLREDGTMPGEKVGIMNSTIDKKFVFLNWFLNWATKKGYNTLMDYKEFKLALKTAKQQIIFLTEDEMIKIRELKLKENQSHLDRVRDVFRFCCFTGIRYSDAYNLRRSNIKGDHIEIVTIKTTDTLNIPLSSSAKSILGKYSSVPFEDDKALPVISNQKMNIYLKELCKLAGVDSPCTITMIKGSKRVDIVRPKYELIGTHTARRTFVSLALSKGNSAEVVMKITGHKSFNTMKPYIAIAKAAKQNAVDSLSGL